MNTKFVPNQAIESGVLTGDVVIRLFVPEDSRPVEIGVTKPEVIVRTEEASFDNSIGEIRCDKAIRIDAEDVSFVGRGLNMLLGEDERTIERLVVDEATQPVRILRRTRSDTTVATAERAPVVTDTTAPAPEAGGTGTPETAPSSVAAAATTEPEQPRFYNKKLRVRRHGAPSV